MGALSPHQRHPALRSRYAALAIPCHQVSDGLCDVRGCVEVVSGVRWGEVGGGVDRRDAAAFWASGGMSEKTLMMVMMSSPWTPYLLERSFSSFLLFSSQ